MYHCEACGRNFVHFKVAGQCPHCKRWLSVRCSGCGYSDHANVFIGNHDRCPKCGAIVAAAGGEDRLAPEEAAIVHVWIFLVLNALVPAVLLTNVFFPKLFNLPAALTKWSTEQLVGVSIWCVFGVLLYLYHSYAKTGLVRRGGLRR